MPPPAASVDDAEKKKKKRKKEKKERKERKEKKGGVAATPPTPHPKHKGTAVVAARGPALTAKVHRASGLLHAPLLVHYDGAVADPVAAWGANNNARYDIAAPTEPGGDHVLQVRDRRRRRASM